MPWNPKPWEGKWVELKEKHPSLDFSMCRPPECATGWFALVDEALTKAEDICRFKVSQIKEKFGALRIYVDPVRGSTPASMNEVIKVLCDAEDRSVEICEVCGGPGKNRTLSNGRLLRTVCDEHYT